MSDNSFSKKYLDVVALIETPAYPHNETSLADWMVEGDWQNMTALEIATEWGGLGHTERDN